LPTNGKLRQETVFINTGGTKAKKAFVTKNAKEQQARNVNTFGNYSLYKQTLLKTAN